MPPVADISVSREGTIDLVEPLGEYDLSNVSQLDDALAQALSDDTTSCLLDLTGVTFLDSTVVRAVVRWSNDAQLSEREALAVVLGEGSFGLRVFELAGLANKLPVFSSRESARTALLEGQRARSERRLRWLTEAELTSAHRDAVAASEAAGRRLREIDSEQRRRSGGDGRAGDA
jgi:anti-anti-sigma factor